MLTLTTTHRLRRRSGLIPATRTAPRLPAVTMDKCPLQIAGKAFRPGLERVQCISHSFEPRSEETRRGAAHDHQGAAPH